MQHVSNCIYITIRCLGNKLCVPCGVRRDPMSLAFGIVCERTLLVLTGALVTTLFHREKTYHLYDSSSSGAASHGVFAARLGVESPSHWYPRDNHKTDLLFLKFHQVGGTSVAELLGNLVDLKVPRVGKRTMHVPLTAILPTPDPCVKLVHVVVRLLRIQRKTIRGSNRGNRKP